MGSSSDRMDDGLGSVECDLRSYALWCTDWRRGATDCDRRAPDDAFRVIDGCWRCSPWGWAAPLSSRRDAADSHVVLYRGSFISVARGGRPLTTVGAKHIRTLRVSPRVHPLYPLLRLPVLLGKHHPLLGQTCSLCEANTFLESKSASACLSSRDKEGGVLRSTAGVSGLPGRISRMGGCPPRFELNFFFQTPRGVNQLHPLLTDVPEVACGGTIGVRLVYPQLTRSS